MTKKKVLLMGKSGAGKTSMRSIIFANFMARDTMRLAPTNIDSSDINGDLQLFVGVMNALERCSPDACIFVLIHKMDLVAESDRDREFQQRAALIQSKTNFQLKLFPTSIWDETLYKAWSQIVYSLIPNINQLESQLKEFREICAADEVVLFEKATFLVISHATDLDSEQYDSHRCERISNIIKQFKISCSKTQFNFQGMEVRNAHFTATIDAFTGNTYIMIVVAGKNKQTSSALLQHNIGAAKKSFEKLIP
eukprot:scaffold2636_cov176-Ochromonas_danica.AAC.17